MTIMVAVALSALLLRLAVEQIIKFNIAQNDSNASTTLKLISAAIESYAKDNHQIFPSNLSVLTKNTPPYLDKEYLLHPSMRGYNYSCPRLEASGYSCVAVPLTCNLTGDMVYSVSTGGLLVAERCGVQD